MFCKASIFVFWIVGGLQIHKRKGIHEVYSSPHTLNILVSSLSFCPLLVPAVGALKTIARSCLFHFVYVVRNPDAQLRPAPSHPRCTPSLTYPVASHTPPLLFIFIQGRRRAAMGKQGRERKRLQVHHSHGLATGKYQG